MNLPNAVKTCFSKAVTWEGRASRSEYWYFALFSAIVYIASAIITASLSDGGRGVAFLPLIVGFALFLPAIAVQVRRLHDINRSGWWYWISLIPVVGGIVLIVFNCQRGTEGYNQYGHVPGRELV